jgi:hypothetical protein
MLKRSFAPSPDAQACAWQELAPAYTIPTQISTRRRTVSTLELSGRILLLSETARSDAGRGGPKILPF